MICARKELLEEVVKYVVVLLHAKESFEGTLVAAN